MRMLQTGTAALFSLAALLVAGASEAGEITVMSTVAVREPYLELVPAFERATENKVATMWVGVSAQNERIKGGEIVDLGIGKESGIDELNKPGRLYPAWQWQNPGSAQRSSPGHQGLTFHRVKPLSALCWRRNQSHCRPPALAASIF